MIPADEVQAAVPDGFTCCRKVPLQSDSELLVDLAQVTNFVLVAFATNYVMGYTQAWLFGMVKSLQITVFIALLSVPFSAETQAIFVVLLACVTYDFLPITDIYDFGFTETDPWNPRFESLGYGSSNFIDSLGSITVFICYLLFRILFSLIIYGCCFSKMQQTWIGRRFKPDTLKSDAIRFVLETFIELLISSLLIFNYVNKTNLSLADKISISFQIGGLLTCVLYVLFLIWFIAAKGLKFVKARAEKVAIWHAVYKYYKIDDKQFKEEELKRKREIEEAKEVNVTLGNCKEASLQLEEISEEVKQGNESGNANQSSESAKQRIKP